MGCARHIGRVGALAVALGVGVAIATMPGIAYADETGLSSAGDTTSTSTTQATDTSTTTDTAHTNGDNTEGHDADDTDPSPSSLDSPSVSVNGVTLGSDPADTETTEQTEDAEQEGDAEESAGEHDPSTTDENAEPTAEGDTQVQESGDGTAAQQSLSEPNVEANKASNVIESSVTTQSTRSAADRSQKPTTAEPNNTVGMKSFAPASIAALSTAATTFTTVTTPVAPPPRPTLVSVVSDLVAAVIRPLLSLGTGTPLQAPSLFAALAAVRDEMERVLFRRPAPVASHQAVSQLVDPTTQRVLVIGVDGTNLSRVLADPTNENFFELMDTSTNSAPSIVGHTTISGPSWSAILTGAWDNKTGVINNIFTAPTYNKWHTVFTQLENHNSDIETMAIGNWNVINGIAGAGPVGADRNVYVPQIAGDTNWLETDDAVAARTVAAIQGTEGPTPNFLFSYFVGVDENGHLYGGASPEYAEAIRNMDDNLGLIMDAVAAREAATCAAGACEDWTIIVVTDHGHQPQQGFGHGFQSPDETETFVIADGPAFGDGLINTDYEIVDVTPTVVGLFGAPQRPNLDGVPLMTLSGNSLDPGDRADLHQALLDQIAMNERPDFITDLALSARTVFATIPYLVYTEVPIPIVREILYVTTNIPAQLVAFLTGVRGANIFPLFPSPLPSESAEQQTTQDLTSADCGTGSADPAACIAS